MIDILEGVIGHDPDGPVPVASIFQNVELVAVLILGILACCRVAKYAAGTAPDVGGLATGINIVTGGRLKRVRGVGRVDVDAVGTVMSIELWVSR